MTQRAPGSRCGKQAIEQPIQLGREEAVEKEVRDHEIVAAGGIPAESIRVVQLDAAVEGFSHAADAPVEHPQHGAAGIDHVRGEQRIRREQLLEKAAIPIAQYQGAPGAAEIRELGSTAALEVGAEACVFHPAVGIGEAIEVTRDPA